MGGRRGGILVRTPEAQSRGVVSRDGTIWDKKERIGGWPAFVIQKVLEVGIGGWVCVRCKAGGNNEAPLHRRCSGTVWPPS